MRMKIAGRTVDVPIARAIALAMILVGALLVIIAWNDQAKIDEIGTTTDPLLQNRLVTLEDERDAALVSGIGFVFLGLFAAVMLREPSSPRPLSEKQMISAAKTANQMLAGLSLAGNATYLPASHGLTKERVFVTAPRNGAVPPTAASDDLVLSPGKDGSTPGVLLEPPGLRLLEYIEQELSVKTEGSGVEAVEGSLQMLKHGFDSMKDFHFKEREGKLVLRVEYDDLLDACREVRKEMPDTCRQVACIGCSCLLTAAARATGKTVSVESVDNGQDTVVFTLELRDW